MAFQSGSTCPNCLSSLPPHARFCSACGRSRDDKTVVELAGNTANPNRSVMLETTVQRTASVSAPKRTRRPPASPAPSHSRERTTLALPVLKPGVVVVVAILFFGLVWVGRWLNAPQKPTHPVMAPIAVVDPDEAEKEARRIQRRLEAIETKDLRDAEAYADGLRARSEADLLQAHLRNSQAPPPSAEPKPYDVIQVHPINGK